jgi:hypothetical protein
MTVISQSGLKLFSENENIVPSNETKNIVYEEVLSIL